METYSQLLDQAADRYEDSELLVFPESRLTYAGLRERADARARELRALGVGAGDRVGILLENRQEYIEVLFGGALLDAVMVPINIRFRARELGHVIETSGVRALVTNLSTESHSGFRGLLDEVAQERGALTCVVSDVTAGPLAAASVAPLPPTSRTGDDIGMLMFTSGTTANPKGCMLSNAALVRNAFSFAEVFELTSEDTIWDPLPFFHLASLVPLTALMTVGGTYVSMTHFEAARGVRQLAEENVTVLYSLFPAVTQDIIHDASFASRPSDTVRLVCNIAPDEVQRNVLAAFPSAQLVSAYGITEATGTVAYSWPEDTVDQRISTCGRPFRGVEAAIIDLETKQRLGTGERGELILRGPTVFKGYFGDPVHTSAAIDDDGWLHTGDICSLDADGRIVYHGRDKDMLKVGGENVGALEVESVLSQHPAVKLAQVVGVPDPRLMEVPAAFIELAPGAEATEEELIEFCRARIARFKVPRHVRFVTEWPMSATKIQKYRLREQLEHELGTPA